MWRKRQPNKSNRTRNRLLSIDRALLSSSSNVPTWSHAPASMRQKQTESNRSKTKRTEETAISLRSRRAEVRGVPSIESRGKSRNPAACGQLNTTADTTRRYLCPCVCISAHTHTYIVSLARRVSDKERRLVASPVASLLGSPRPKAAARSR